MTVLEDNDFYTLSHDPDTSTITHVMKQRVTGQVFKDLLTAGAAALAQHHATKWLSDDRNNTMLTPADMAWSAAWLPGAVATGWKHWAMVAAQASLPIKHMFTANYAEAGLNAKLFTDINEARAWLEEQA